MSNINYRAEIDGLRAIAVLSVLFFHAGLICPGGYVGVDVFFVISGYLITKILLKELANETFSFKKFMARRVKRILPAQLVLCVVTLCLGVFLLDPISLKQLSIVSIYQAALSSNIYLGLTSGYFSTSAEHNALLHMWSLAVEEQFYLIYPWVLYFSIKKKLKFWKWVFIFLALGSFLLSVLITETGIYQSLFYYQLPTRAWELLVGAIVARSHQYFLIRSKWLSEIVTFSGLGLIFWAIFSYSSKTVFPGINALIPVLGTAACILGSENHETLSKKLLSFRPLVFIGLISYSLYLWHWPLLSLSKHIFIECPIEITLLLLFTSFLLAILSFYFIERPFRTFKPYHPVMAIYWGAGAITISFILAGSVYVYSDIKSREENLLNLRAEDIFWTGEEYRKSAGKPTRIGIERPGEKVDFAVWGDSHAMVLMHEVERLAEENKIFGDAYFHTGTVPVPGLIDSRWNMIAKESVEKERKEILKSLLQSKPKVLLLGSSWASHFSKKFDISSQDENNIKMESDKEIKRKKIKIELYNMLRTLSQAGIKVFLIKQVPNCNVKEAARNFYLSTKYPNWNSFEEFSISYGEHQEKNRFANEILDSIDIEGCSVLDIADHFFENKEKKLKLYSDRSYYKDPGHLTRYGVTTFLGEDLSLVLSEAKDL